MKFKKCQNVPNGSGDLPRSEVVIAIGTTQTDTRFNVVRDLTMCVRFHFAGEIISFANATSDRLRSQHRRRIPYVCIVLRSAIATIQRTQIVLVAIGRFVAITAAPTDRCLVCHLFGLHVELGGDIGIVQTQQMFVGDFAVARESVQRWRRRFMRRNSRPELLLLLLLIQSFGVGVVIVENVVVVVRGDGIFERCTGVLWRGDGYSSSGGCRSRSSTIRQMVRLQVTIEQKLHVKCFRTNRTAELTGVRGQMEMHFQFVAAYRATEQTL